MIGHGEAYYHCEPGFFFFIYVTFRDKDGELPEQPQATKLSISQQYMPSGSERLGKYASWIAPGSSLSLYIYILPHIPFTSDKIWLLFLPTAFGSILKILRPYQNIPLR